MSFISKSKSVSPDSLVFDLDGTLWDSCMAVASGWTQGAHKLGFQRTITAPEIASICGLPTPDCIRTLCPEIGEDLLPKALEVFGRFEKQQLIKLGGKLYPSVFDGLVKLKSKYPLFLVSNCQEWYLKCFFDLHGTADLFVDWECFGRALSPKSENLKAVALRNGLQNPLYVGDTKGDHSAALAAGYDFAFVSYGFGQVDCENRFSDFNSLVEKYL